jgi:polysaccharide deacetylase family protein (PEP-CTERM system associated)
VITFTIDLEDSTERYEPNGRYVAMSYRILDLCDEYQRRATFFVVGRVAAAAPRLIRDIAAKGHEIAFHSHAHVPLNKEDPVRFKRETLADCDRLEQLAGKKIIGFRAPRFSLTPQSLWAIDILRDLGFRYSSSIMPTSLSLYGFAKAPRTPFRWPNGLIELPLPVTKFSRMPYLGGVYLYMLPFFLTQRAVAQADPDEILWTYTHPYDFDIGQKFTPMPHTPLWIDYILWIARRRATPKICKILQNGKALPLGERIEKLKWSLDTYS